MREICTYTHRTRSGQSFTINQHPTRDSFNYTVVGATEGVGNRERQNGMDTSKVKEVGTK